MSMNYENFICVSVVPAMSTIIVQYEVKHSHFKNRKGSTGIISKFQCYIYIKVNIENSPELNCYLTARLRYA
mgnify:CR=1 FL=1